MVAVIPCPAFKPLDSPHLHWPWACPPVLLLAIGQLKIWHKQRWKKKYLHTRACLLLLLLRMPELYEEARLACLVTRGIWWNNPCHLTCHHIKLCTCEVILDHPARWAVVLSHKFWGVVWSAPKLTDSYMGTWKWGVTVIDIGGLWPWVWKGAARTDWKHSEETFR